MDLLQLLNSISGVATNATVTAQDLESEVRNAKLYAVLTVGLLAFIAYKVKDR